MGDKQNITAKLSKRESKAFQSLVNVLESLRATWNSLNPEELSLSPDHHIALDLGEGSVPEIANDTLDVHTFGSYLTLIFGALATMINNSIVEVSEDSPIHRALIESAHAVAFRRLGAGLARSVHELVAAVRENSECTDPIAMFYAWKLCVLTGAVVDGFELIGSKIEGPRVPAEIRCFLIACLSHPFGQEPYGILSGLSPSYAGSRLLSRPHDEPSREGLRSKCARAFVESLDAQAIDACTAQAIDLLTVKSLMSKLGRSSSEDAEGSTAFDAWVDAVAESNPESDELVIALMPDELVMARQRLLSGIKSLQVSDDLLKTSEDAIEIANFAAQMDADLESERILRTLALRTTGIEQVVFLAACSEFEKASAVAVKLSDVELQKLGQLPIITHAAPRTTRFDAMEAIAFGIDAYEKRDIDEYLSFSLDGISLTTAMTFPPSIFLAWIHLHAKQLNEASLCLHSMDVDSNNSSIKGDVAAVLAGVAASKGSYAEAARLFEVSGRYGPMVRALIHADALAEAFSRLRALEDRVEARDLYCAYLSLLDYALELEQERGRYEAEGCHLIEDVVERLNTILNADELIRLLYTQPSYTRDTLVYKLCVGNIEYIVDDRETFFPTSPFANLIDLVAECLTLSDREEMLQLDPPPVEYRMYDAIHDGSTEGLVSAIDATSEITTPTFIFELLQVIRACHKRERKPIGSAIKSLAEAIKSSGADRFQIEEEFYYVLRTVDAIAPSLLSVSIGHAVDCTLRQLSSAKVHAVEDCLAIEKGLLSGAIVAELGCPEINAGLKQISRRALREEASRANRGSKEKTEPTVTHGFEEALKQSGADMLRYQVLTWLTKRSRSWLIPVGKVGEKPNAEHWLTLVDSLREALLSLLEEKRIEHMAASQQRIWEARVNERDAVIADLSHHIKNLIASMHDSLQTMKGQLAGSRVGNSLDHAIRGATLIREMVHAMTLSYRGKRADFLQDVTEAGTAGAKIIEELLASALATAACDMLDTKYFNQFSRNYFPDRESFTQAKDDWASLTEQGLGLQSVEAYISRHIIPCEIKLQHCDEVALLDKNGSQVKMLILMTEVLLNALKYSGAVDPEKRFLRISANCGGELRLEVHNSCSEENTNRSKGLGLKIMNNMVSSFGGTIETLPEGATYSVIIVVPLVAMAEEA